MTISEGSVVAPIGVVVAMETELQHLLARVTPVREVQNGPWRDRFVLAGDVPLVALCSGIGMESCTGASDYIRLWQGDQKLLLASFERIQRTAAVILDSLNERPGGAPEIATTVGVAA